MLQQYHRGSIIFQEDAPIGFIYLLRDGLIKLSVEGPGGINKPLAIVSTAESACEILDKRSLSRSVHSCTCEALSPCQLYCLPKATFNWLMKQEFGLTQEVILTLSEEVDFLLNKVKNETHFSGRQRLAQLLLRLKKIQAGQKGKHSSIFMDLSRQELASMIGVARETLTRLLSDLSKQGIIKITADNIVIEREDQLAMYGTHNEFED